jgi:hypothetical protein
MTTKDDLFGWNRTIQKLAKGNDADKVMYVLDMLLANFGARVGDVLLHEDIVKAKAALTRLKERS